MPQTSNGLPGPERSAGGDEGHDQRATSSVRERLKLRDMLGAVVLLMVVVGVVAVFTRGCQFSPGRPSVDQGSVPSVDASRELSRAAAVQDFAIRLPALPSGWRANSANTARVDGSAAVRVGWLTDRDNYLRLSQSRAAQAPLAAAEAGEGAGVTPVPKGEVDVNGTRWAVYPGRGQEPAWVAQLDGVTILVTGSGTEDEFRTMAAAVQAAPPLPKEG